VPKYSAPPYMHDVLPYEPPKDGWLHAARWRAVEKTFRELCRQYGYREIRTPVMEQTELFTRSIGEGTDIVSKEMFTFTDRGGRSMTLRPEGTAPVIRSFVEHKMHGEATVSKLYYIATIYRYERGQRGRYREHQQTGVEALGSQDPAIDAEVITIAMEFYRRLGIQRLEMKVNSVGCPVCRPLYRQALVEYARPRLEQMSDDNRMRFEVNPLRMLDSKDERDQRAMADAPRLLDHLCEDCRAHFETLQTYLKLLEVPFVIDTSLVRGFDYYTKTAFEVVSPDLGAQNAIGGGGRYDGLVEECGGPPTPGIGFGIGTERCLLVLDELGIELPIEDEQPLVFVAAFGEAARPEAVRLLHELRGRGLSADMDYAGRSPKAQFRTADRLGARFVAILGDDEIAQGAVTLKNMSRGDQLSVRRSEILTHLAQEGGKNEQTTADE
jgi:histidyl-tRNA synthetase